VKHFDEKLVERLIENNIKTVKHVVNLTVESIVQIEGFKLTLAEKLVSQIKQCLANIDLITLMVASNSWGHGFSFKKLKLILDKYPDILDDQNVTVDQINDINGYSKITSQQFIDGLEEFKKFVKENSFEDIIKRKTTITTPTSTKYKDQTFVLSGFRDSELEKYIIDNGGKISSSVSKNTTAVITKNFDSSLDNSQNTSKVKKAKELGIEIIDVKKFLNM
jgi:NAD-dependent DNA ligase